MTRLENHHAVRAPTVISQQFVRLNERTDVLSAAACYKYSIIILMYDDDNHHHVSMLIIIIIIPTDDYHHHFKMKIYVEVPQPSLLEASLCTSTSPATYSLMAGPKTQT